MLHLSAAAGHIAAEPAPVVLPGLSENDFMEAQCPCTKLADAARALRPMQGAHQCALSDR